jgi:hypothetical protein
LANVNVKGFNIRKIEVIKETPANRSQVFFRLNLLILQGKTGEKLL